MEPSVIQENWNELKIKLQQKFSYLTDKDILFKEGKIEDLLERLQIKLGKTKVELRKTLAEL
jgi:uncharacterized protein YjbJ (UPF0337 family)